jgi:hypothetical protein
MGWELGLPLPMAFLKPCNKSPFSASLFPSFFICYIGASDWTWHVEFQEFGSWFQNTSFNFSLLYCLLANSRHKKSFCGLSGFLTFGSEIMITIPIILREWIWERQDPAFPRVLGHRLSMSNTMEYCEATLKMLVKPLLSFFFVCV